MEYIFIKSSFGYIFDIVQVYSIERADTACTVWLLFAASFGFVECCVTAVRCLIWGCRVLCDCYLLPHLGLLSAVWLQSALSIGACMLFVVASYCTSADDRELPFWIYIGEWILFCCFLSDFVLRIYLANNRCCSRQQQHVL